MAKSYLHLTVEKTEAGKYLALVTDVHNRQRELSAICKTEKEADSKAFEFASILGGGIQNVIFC